VMEILIDAEACYGCRMCELACSFHHKGVFSPGASSIKVSRDNQDGELRLSIDSSCDLCRGESYPQCVEYCVYEALKEVN
jgi:carbon-monoxide dehydrogenase iron sulfur subunit